MMSLIEWWMGLSREESKKAQESYKKSSQRCGSWVSFWMRL